MKDKATGEEGKEAKDIQGSSFIGVVKEERWSSERQGDGRGGERSQGYPGEKLHRCSEEREMEQ